MSCLWWLSNYWSAQVLAFEPHPGHAAQARTNIALNGYGPRVTFHDAAVGPKAGKAHLSDAGASSSLLCSAGAGFEVEVLNLFEILAGRRIDILKIDIEGSEVALLDDPRFDGLDVGAVVVEWHTPDTAGRGGREWCVDRLQKFGFSTYITADQGEFGMLWGYRR